LLFVEEVTRLLLERGDGGGIQSIPPTLQQSLTARLDRLGYTSFQRKKFLRLIGPVDPRSVRLTPSQGRCRFAECIPKAVPELAREGTFMGQFFAFTIDFTGLMRHQPPVLQPL
jgi:hypothetical protein